MMRLTDVSDMAATEDIAMSLAQFRNVNRRPIGTLKDNVARVGGQDARDQVKQRGNGPAGFVILETK
jgi:hypothetical protein